MRDIAVAKLAGYSLVLGPILALVCYFIQPGGILGIGGGTADPTDSSAVVKLLADNPELGTLTSLLIPVGVLVFLSGIMFFVQNMAGGSGHAVARLGLPMVMVVDLESMELLYAERGWSVETVRTMVSSRL